MSAANGERMSAGPATCSAKAPARRSSPQSAEDLAVLAKIDFAAETVGAHATRYRGVERDATLMEKFVPSLPARQWFQRLHVPSQSADAAAGRTVVTVDIAAADSASSHAHQNFARRRRWHGAIGDFQMIVSREQKSFHGLVAHCRRTVRSPDWPLGCRRNVNLRIAARFSLISSRTLC